MFPGACLRKKGQVEVLVPADMKTKALDPESIQPFVIRHVVGEGKLLHVLW